MLHDSREQPGITRLKRLNVAIAESAGLLRIRGVHHLNRDMLRVSPEIWQMGF